MQFNLDPKILVAGAFVSLISVLPFNEGFYIFTRVVVCLSALYGTFYLNKRKDSLWIIFGLITVLYNPIVPVYLHSKALWVIINLLTAIFFFRTYYLSNEYDVSATASIVQKFLFYLGRGFVILGFFYFPLAIIFGYPHVSSWDREGFFFGLFVFLIFYLVFPRIWNYLFFKNAKFWMPDPSNVPKDSKELEK